MNGSVGDFFKKNFLFSALVVILFDGVVPFVLF